MAPASIRCEGVVITLLGVRLTSGERRGGWLLVWFSSFGLAFPRYIPPDALLALECVASTALTLDTL